MICCCFHFSLFFSVFSRNNRNIYRYFGLEKSIFSYNYHIAQQFTIRFTHLEMEQPELKGEDSTSVMFEYEYVFAFIFVHSVIVLEDVAGLSSSTTMNGHSSFSQLLMLILPLLSKAKINCF